MIVEIRTKMISTSRVELQHTLVREWAAPFRRPLRFDEYKVEEFPEGTKLCGGTVTVNEYGYSEVRQWR